MRPDRRMTCKRCGRVCPLNFRVCDSEWRAVVPARLRSRVVCLACFDELAGARDWWEHLLSPLYFVGRDGKTGVFHLEGMVR